ncbi:transporter, cation channel family protein [Trichuris suis]|nr:transporter, cation channel family protein [Trichuris suis]
MAFAGKMLDVPRNLWNGPIESLNDWFKRMTRNNEVVAVSQSHIWSLRIGSEPDNPHLHMKESGIDVDLNSMVKNKCKAIEDDSDKRVKKCIASSAEALFTLNKMQLSPLEYSVILKKEAMVELICSYNAVTARDAILFAVQVKHQKILKILLQRFPGVDQGTKNSNYFPPYLTPIVLAAIMENGVAYEELLDAGHVVNHLTVPRCSCDQCISKGEDADEDVIEDFMTELDSFRFHASEAALLEDRAEPVSDMFVLCKELEIASQRNTSRAFAYEALMEKVKKFVAKFPAYCETSDQVLRLLKRTQGSKMEHVISLPLLELAVETEQKYFLAERNCFTVVQKHWLGTWSDWRVAPLMIRVMRIATFSIFHPFTIIGNVRVKGVVDFNFNPCAKYLSTLSSYICFLFALNLVACRGKHDWRNLPADHLKLGLLIYAFLYALGSLSITLTELYRLGYGAFVSSWWRCYDFFQAILFVAFFNGFVINFLAPSQVAQLEINKQVWPAEHSETVLEMMFAFILVCSVFRLFYFLQLNPYIGPLMVTISRSVTCLIRYLVIYFVCIMAFAIGLNFLYEHYKYNVMQRGSETIVQSDYMTSIRNAIRYLYWAWYGYMHPTFKLHIVVGNAGPDKNPVEHGIVQWIGNLIAGTYHLLVVISLLHLMTSMMAVEISDYESTSTIDYRFQCCKVWIDYFNDCRTYPPPFCLFVFFYNGTAILIRSFFAGSKPRERISIWSRKYDLPVEDEEETERHQDLIRLLVKRIRSEQIYDLIPPEVREACSGEKNESLWPPQQQDSLGLSKAAFLK